MHKTYKLIIYTGTFLFFLLLLSNYFYYADYQTNLLQGVYIKDGPSDIEAGRFSVPVVHDWDNDGKKDLLVGQNYIDENKTGHGYISFYKNIGTDASPVFDGSIQIQTCSAMCTSINVDAFG